MLQLERHKALYRSVNEYSQAIANSKPDMSPLGVLKCAIELHQANPRLQEPCKSASGITSKNVPLVQPDITAARHEVPPLSTIQENVKHLKAVLPSVPEVKLATLLSENAGDMNAVVQSILEQQSATNDELAGCRFIDLTGEDDEKPDDSLPSSYAYETPEARILSCIDVETSTLRSILETVKEKEASSKPPETSNNLLSFHRPSASLVVFGSSNATSEILSLPKACNDCQFCQAPRKYDDKFCHRCGGVFPLSNKRWWTQNNPK